MRSKTQPPDSVVEAYLGSHDNWFDEVVWSVIYRFGHGRPIYRFVQKQRDTLELLFGNEDVQNKIQNLIEFEAREAIRSRNAAQKDTAIAWQRRELTLRGSTLAIWGWELDFHIETGQWDRVVHLLQDALDDKRFYIGHETLNTVASRMSRECTSQKHLRWAVRIMKDVTARKPKWQYFDTYIALLIKTGDTKEAEKQALRAIELGNKVGDEMTRTRELLDQIRSADKK